jgi:hypothetical protein
MLRSAEGETEQKVGCGKEKTHEEIMESICEHTISNRGKIWQRKKDRGIEKAYSVKQMVAKLRRLSDCLENDFKILIAGEMTQIPASAIFIIEHELEGNKEEVEFQFKWER